MREKGQWFHPISWPGWGEEALLKRARPGGLNVPDQESAKPVLYGPRGEVLIQRAPRPLGFRRPGA